jgi:alkanesulfonate monooxygenase SsuD/methylene tetrahydromethanopterin reductase-like flavin-dependent oxidoreductase (luciferase family)
MTVRVGLALPSFVADPEIPISVARAAEDAELDGVFVYDHLWRGDPPNRRPALECLALLGAIAAATSRIHVGTLVARATLRPPATLANGLLTADRVSGGRLIAGIGSGDRHSQAENEGFGLPFGTMAERVDALRAAVNACVGNGFPVWVGGLSKVVREIVALANGWNGWGTEPDVFASEIELVREVAPDAAITWGGLARPIEEGADALAERVRPYCSLGASWIIIGPVDSSNPDNAPALGELKARLGE